MYLLRRVSKLWRLLEISVIKDSRRKLSKELGSLRRNAKKINNFPEKTLS
jgi:hypothetical protein